MNDETGDSTEEDDVTGVGRGESETDWDDVDGGSWFQTQVKPSHRKPTRSVEAFNHHTPTLHTDRQRHKQTHNQ